MGIKCIKCSDGIKLPQNFLESQECKKILNVANGRKYLLIFLEIMLEASANDGKITFENVGDDLEEEIALLTDEDKGDIKITLDLLVSLDIIERTENYIVFKNLI